jgi:hypothetical protein
MIRSNYDKIMIIILIELGDRLKKNSRTKLKSIKLWMFILKRADVHIAKIIKSSIPVFNPLHI